MQPRFDYQPVFSGYMTCLMTLDRGFGTLQLVSVDMMCVIDRFGVAAKRTVSI